ncbi:MAG: Sjogren's syndrome/scleroderma autoantigen 1 family protein [Halorhabdus sp.]
MSDFDKEAERERLREQFEREQEKRQATEHMSDLLLKGATMTDAHCEECGDPIFRYDGQEFCPTCQQPVNTGDEGAAEPQDSEAAAAADASPSAADAHQTGADATSEQETHADGDQGAVEETHQSEESLEQVPDQSNRVEVPTATPTADRATGRASNADGDLADARESLVATLVTFARQAEATENPRRASEALAAARDAADALAALENVR